MATDFITYDPSLPLEEKKNILLENNRTAHNLKRQMQSPTQRIISIREQHREHVEEKKDEQPEELDAKFYELYQKVINSTPNSLQSDISSVITPDDSEYFFYMSMLKIKLHEDIVSLSNLYYETEEEEQTAIKGMYFDTCQILGSLDELEEEEELIKSSKGRTNNLYFLTSMNRVIMFENIDKDIPIDMYSQVLELINSIITGEFKGLKYMNGKKMFEVRLGEIRITFAKLINNEFLMINCFLKKYDTSRSYREMMERYRSIYLREKNVYKELIEDEDFRRLNQKYLDDIIELCSKKGRVRK